MNKVILIGRLTRDFDLRYGSNNTAVARTSIAVDRQFTGQNGERGADFINIVVFGNRAETMKKYISKGNRVAIFGRIQTGSYDANDGRKVYTTDVVVEEFQFLETKNNQLADNFVQENQAAPVEVTPYDFSTNEENTVDTDPFKDFGDKIAIDDSELPF